MSSDENDSARENENVFSDESTNENNGSVPTLTTSALPHANRTSVKCGSGGLRSASGVRVADFAIVLGVASFFFALLFAVLLYNRRKNGQREGSGSAPQPRAMENSGRWRRKVAPATLTPAPGGAVIEAELQVEEDVLNGTEHTDNADEEDFVDEDNVPVEPSGMEP